MSSPHSPYVPSPLSSLLRSPNCSLRELIELPDVLQQLPSNSLLRACLCESENIDLLIDFVCGEDDEHYQRKATAIICANEFAVVETLTQATACIQKLVWQLTVETAPDEFTLSCVAQVLTVLIKPATTKIFDSIEIDQFVSALARHFDNYDVASFVVEIIKRGKVGELDCTRRFCEEGLVSCLLDAFIRANDPDTAASALEPTVEGVTHIIQELVLLKQFAIYQNNPAEVFVDFFNTNERLAEFVDSVFRQSNPLVLDCGFQVLSSMLACSASSSEACPLPVEGLPNVFRVLAPHYPEMARLLAYTDGPVGAPRIQLTYMLLSLVLSNYTGVFDAIIHNNMLSALVDTFFSYNHTCTIFRQIAFDVLNCIVKRPIDILRDHLFASGFPKRTIAEFKTSRQFLEQNGYYPDHHALLVVLMNSIYLSNTKDIDAGRPSDPYVLDEFVPFFTEVVLPEESTSSTYFPGRVRSVSPIHDSFDDEKAQQFGPIDDLLDVDC